MAPCKFILVYLSPEDIEVGAKVGLEARKTTGVKVGAGVLLLLVGAPASSSLLAGERLQQELYHVHRPAIWLTERVVFKSKSLLFLNKLADPFGVELLKL